MTIDQRHVRKARGRLSAAALRRVRFSSNASPDAAPQAAVDGQGHTTGFNDSSDRHEGASWFSESARVDPRVASVESWEAATAKGPLFVLDVPWLRTGLSLRQVVERVFKNQRAPRAAATSAGDLARLVFNQQ